MKKFETSDYEKESNNKENEGVYVYCIYDKNYKKRWKPYKICKTSNLIDDFSKIKSLEEKSCRI